MSGLPESCGLARGLAGVLVFSLFLAGGCDRENSSGEVASPAGTIQELQAESSITTDVNARTPAFVRTDTEGKVQRPQDFVGRRVLLLDFWSVFCKSCIEEMPFLLDLYARYRDQGLEILSINTDFFPWARIKRFLTKTGLDLPFPLILDRDQSLSRLFHVDALPVMVLIDSSGWIRMVHLGYRPADKKMVESRVRKACREIRETVVTLQPVEGQTAFAPIERGRPLLPAGSAVPEFRAKDADGETVIFSELRSGAPALIFFWSLFCKPCREELPRLEALAKKHASKGLRSFAVNIDSAKLHPATVKFSKKRMKDIVSLFDRPEGEENGGVADLFGVHYTPSLFLVASDGTVRFSSSGELPPGKIEGEIAAILDAGINLAEPDMADKDR